MSVLRIRCEICGEEMAEADPEVLRFPMEGRMFKTFDSWHGVPDPFDPSATWEDMMCPFGRQHRPFIDRGKVMLDDGTLYEVKAREPEGKTLMEVFEEEGLLEGPLPEFLEPKEEDLLEGGGLEIRFADKEEIAEILSDPGMKYTCGRCSEEFETRDELSDHLETHKKKTNIPRELLICTICGREIKGSGPMACHMRTHTDG